MPKPFSLSERLNRARTKASAEAYKLVREAEYTLEICRTNRRNAPKESFAFFEQECIRAERELAWVKTYARGLDQVA